MSDIQSILLIIVSIVVGCVLIFRRIDIDEDKIESLEIKAKIDEYKQQKAKKKHDNSKKPLSDIVDSNNKKARSRRG